MALNIWDRSEIYKGPYVNNAPDLIVGYNIGYRSSWDSVQGKISDNVFENNTKAWKGDHCLDPTCVPGVLFTSFKHNQDKPHIMDIAPTALHLLGANVPSYIEGKPLLE